MNRLFFFLLLARPPLKIYMFCTLKYHSSLPTSSRKVSRFCYLLRWSFNYDTRAVLYRFDDDIDSNRDTTPIEFQREERICSTPTVDAFENENKLKNASGIFQSFFISILLQYCYFVVILKLEWHIPSALPLCHADDNYKFSYEMAAPYTFF